MLYTFPSCSFNSLNTKFCEVEVSFENSNIHWKLREWGDEGAKVVGWGWGREGGGASNVN